MTDFFFWASTSAVITLVFCSFFEWTLHRFVMHRPLGPFRYPFRTHTLVHHRIFRADHSYHLTNEADKWTIPMAWWNGPVLIAICSLPFAVIGYLLGEWGILVGAVVTLGAYYA